jgi:hypothetical protein
MIRRRICAPSVACVPAVLIGAEIRPPMLRTFQGSGKPGQYELHEISNRVSVSADVSRQRPQIPIGAHAPAQMIDMKLSGDSK